MKIKKTNAFIFGCLVLSLFGCKKLVKPESAKEREEWRASLTDSITVYQAKIDSIQMALAEIHSKIGNTLNNFTYISNPREVSGYYILDGWQNRYPLKQTGIVARINEDEALEVIAALSKGSFTHVSLSSEGQEYTSRPVPHDQAFNYKTADLNTVCFTGGSADSIAMFISNHRENPIKLTFIENNTTGNFTIPQDEKNMISSTWNLYSTQREAKEIEKSISLYSARINACRKIIETTDSIN